MILNGLFKWPVGKFLIHNLSYIEDIFFKMIGNTYRKTVETSNGNGSVFYPIFSLVSHICSPNAKFLVYPNHCMAMQAQRLIKSGEEISVSYVPTLEPTWKRRAMLYR